MWEIICAVTILFFSLLGFVTTLRLIVLRIFKPKESDSILLLSANKSSAEDIEYTLRAWATRICWMGKSAPQKIVIAENELNYESKEICRRMCKEYKFISMADINDLSEALNKKDT